MSSELLERILEAPDFHKNGQVPCMNGRGPHCVRKLILEPMASGTAESRPNQEGIRDESSELFKYCLNLQFLLPDEPNDDEIKRMCEGLRDLILTDRFFARQILWQGLYPKEHARSEIPRLVREYAMRWENQRLKNKIRTLSHGRSRGEEGRCDDGNESTVPITRDSKRGSDELDAPNSETTTGNSSPSKKLRIICD